MSAAVIDHRDIAGHMPQVLTRLSIQAAVSITIRASGFESGA
jgi:hypothetical protein